MDKHNEAWGLNTVHSSHCVIFNTAILQYYKQKGNCQNTSIWNKYYDKKWAVKQTIHIKSFQEGKTEAGLKYDKQQLHFVQEQRKVAKVIGNRMIPF
jgi:hypothetical protein